MAGTKLGGLKAAATNKEKYGKDFYRNIGRKGGQNGTTGGFFANRELAIRAGRKGGLKSRRGPSILPYKKTVKPIVIDSFLHIMKCVICGESFVGGRKALTCSDECRKEHRRRQSAIYRKEKRSLQN